MLGQTTNWLRVYIGAMLAGAGLGALLVLHALPVVPQQLTTWLSNVPGNVGAVIVPIICGVLFGAALAAVAHCGIRWQLRQRSNSDLP